MATPQVLENFIVNKLQLSDWKLIQEESTYKLVEKIVLAFEQHIYFQNVTWGATPIGERLPPTPQEAIELILLDGKENKGNGACCIHSNYALVLVLQHLGLDAFLLGADEWVQPGLHDTHVLTIWHNPNDKEVYAMDVGYPRPIPFLIPLHNLPFEGKVGGFRFTMTLNEESGNYERTLYGGCPGYGPLKEFENGQRKEYYFSSTLTPRPFSHFDNTMGKLFTGPEGMFLRSIRLSRILRFESPEDFEYVAVIRKSVVLGSSTEFNRTVYETYKEMMPVILEYFPKLDHETLVLALEKFDEYAKEKEKQFDPRENP